jgi:hypothetical protein
MKDKRAPAATRLAAANLILARANAASYGVASRPKRDLNAADRVRALLERLASTRTAEPSSNN